eukprot:7382968-Prymnesium_polylepis.1
MHKAAIKKVHDKEQRTGEQSVAADLRGVYLAKREQAKEVVELRRRLSALRAEQKDKDEAELEVRATAEEGRLVMAVDVDDVLGEDDDNNVSHLEPYELPSGYVVIEEPPPENQLIRFTLGVSAPAIVGKPIMFNYGGYGWIVGNVLRRNGDQRRKMVDGTIANFVVEFQMDNGRSTAVVLDSED